MTTFRLLLWPHVLAGIIALLVLAVPLLAPKGGPLHRRFGWIFVWAMGATAVSGMALGAFRLVLGPRAVDSWRGAFLVYIGLLTAAGVWKGVRVLRLKNRTGPNHRPIDLAPPALVLGGGLLATFVGLELGRPLWLVSGIVGAAGGWSNLRYWLRPPGDAHHWWSQHMGDMVGAGIAAVTAFLVLNAVGLGFGFSSLLAWLGPTAIGVPGLLLWRRHYRRNGGPAIGWRGPGDAGGRRFNDEQDAQHIGAPALHPGGGAGRGWLWRRG
jgi:uncharacterized membrane protein